jgi:hypothetical protein
MACRALGVRRQGFYEWCSGVKSPRAEEHIERIHAESRATYGWPRVHADLTLGLGLPVNHERVAQLMREAGIQGELSHQPSAAARARPPLGVERIGLADTRQDQLRTTSI